MIHSCLVCVCVWNISTHVELVPDVFGFGFKEVHQIYAGGAGGTDETGTNKDTRQLPVISIWDAGSTYLRNMSNFDMGGGSTQEPPCRRFCFLSYSEPDLSTFGWCKPSNFGWCNPRLRWKFPGYGDGCYDYLFGVYLELEREGPAPILNFFVFSDQDLTECFCTPDAFHITIG